jgi:glycosyltransferase involved in cell wall biosynthesis
MGEAVKLSILINNYNYAPYLGACIDSALAQDHADLEVVVVDDGSTDDSRAVIAGYGDRIVPVLKENGGQASSFNAGFAAASGEVLLLLDSDDAFLPGKASIVARQFADPAIGWCFDHVTTQEGAAIATDLQVRHADYRDAMRRGSFPHVPVPTSGLSFRRETLGGILPMPTARDVVLSDNYLKFAAAFLAPGVVVETPLTFQRIHGTNRYTGVGARHPLRSRIMVATGTELARRYAGMGRIGRHLIAGGFAEGDLSLTRATREAGAAAEAAGFNRGDIAKTCAMTLRKRLASHLRGARS